MSPSESGRDRPSGAGGKPDQAAASARESTEGKPVLEMSGIYKRFDATQALADVSPPFIPARSTLL